MHSCPNCGESCYCGGDIDDSDVGDVEAEEECNHCSELDDEDPLDDYIEGYGEEL